MDSSYDDDEQEIAVPLISRPGIPTAIIDNRQPYQKRLAVYIILLSTLLERIAFYTLAGNLAFNIATKAPTGPSNSTLSPTTVSYIFSGLSYISTIIFAILGDWKWGRAKTIIIGFGLYIVAYIMAVIISNPNASITKSSCHIEKEDTLFNGLCLYWLFPTLTIIALGAGAVQSQIAVFGAEQIQESKLTSRYFDKYVIAVNISAIFGVMVIRAIYDNLCQKYFVPSIIALSTLVSAAILFIGGWKYYIHVPPYDTVVTNFFPVIINAFQTWRRYKKNKYLRHKHRINSVSANTLAAEEHLPNEGVIERYERPRHFLDFAKGAYNGKFSDRTVNDVRSLREALIVLTLFIPFWLIYNQLSSTFALQGKYMNTTIKISIKNCNYTETSDHMVYLMWLANPLTIIIVVSILSFFVYKCIDARNPLLTIPAKFIIGMCFAILSMVAAGTVEYFRQSKCVAPQSELKIVYQIPQYILVGFAESFATVASFDYAYFAAPRSASSLFMSLRFCSLGASSFIGIGYIAAFARNSSTLDFQCTSRQPPTDLDWRFPSYFFGLGAIQLIFMIIFIVCQRKFQIIKLNPQQLEAKQFIH